MTRDEEFQQYLKSDNVWNNFCINSVTLGKLWADEHPKSSWIKFQKGFHHFKSILLLQ